MKRWRHCLFVLVVLAFIVFGTQTVMAQEGKTADGFCWCDDRRTSTVIINGYEGSEKDISIPSVINNMPVVKIGERAFFGKDITKVTFPDSVRYIDNEAFLECTSLKEVIFSDIIVVYTKAFMNCTNLEKVSFGSSFNHGDGGEEDQFTNCPKLLSVSLPEDTDFRVFHCPRVFGYYIDNGTYKKISGFTIHGKYYTGAELYANEHGFIYDGTAIDLIADNVVLEYSAIDYAGSEKKPNVVVYNDPDPDSEAVYHLINQEDYSVSYSNNVNVGTATVTVTGKNKCKGTVKKTFKINPMSINGNVKSTPNGLVQYYTGSEIRPGVTVVRTSDNKTLKEGVDYQLTYANNKNVGMATVTVTGINNYTGTDTASFQIIEDATVKKPTEKVDEKKPTDKAKGDPQAAKTTVKEPITINKVPASVKAKAKKNKVTVSWKKIKKNKAGKKLLKQIKSIQVQYSTDPKFKKDVKTKSVGKTKTKVKLKLQKKTTYYVRVRYKGANGFSKWSKVKKVKTK